jgi:hypothetical protein
MRIKESKSRNEIILQDVKIKGTNFSAAKGRSSGGNGPGWDQYNDGTKRTLAIDLTEEEAKFFTDKGCKVIFLEAKEKMDRNTGNPTGEFFDPQWFLILELYYKNKQKPIIPFPETGYWNTFEFGPRVVQIEEDYPEEGMITRTDLWEDTVDALDKRRITMMDIQVHLGYPKAGSRAKWTKVWVDGLKVWTEVDDFWRDFKGLPPEYDEE